MRKRVETGRSVVFSEHPSSLAEEQPSLVDHEEQQIACFLILLDLQFTLLHYTWSDGEPTVRTTRPHATELLQMLLKKQQDGECMLGFYTPLWKDHAVKVVGELLAGATANQWKPEDEAPVMKSVLGHKVSNFDDEFIEKDDSRTDRAGWPLHTKSLIRIFSETERSGRPCSARSTIYITCDRSEEMQSKEDHGNLVQVKPFRGVEQKGPLLKHVKEYLCEMCKAKVTDVRDYLRDRPFAYF